MRGTKSSGAILALVKVVLAVSLLDGCGGSGSGSSPTEPSPGSPNCSPPCAAGAACVSGTCSTISLAAPLATTDAEGVHVGGKLLLSVLPEGVMPTHVEITIDGGSVFSVQSGITEIPADRLAVGPHLLVATARYATANGATVAASPVQLRFLVDRSVPVLSWEPGPGVVSLVGISEISLRAGEPLAPVFPAQDIEVIGSDLDSATLPPHDVAVDAPAGLVTIRFAAPLDFVNELTVRTHVTDRAGNTSANPIATWTQPPLRIAVDPSGPVWTNATAVYGVTVEGGHGEEVTLEFNPATDSLAALVVPLTGPPYSATIDTTWLGESIDPWYVRARVRRGLATFVSEVHSLYVDRYPPSVSRCGPRWGAIEEAYLEEPLLGEFSEAMNSSTFRSGIAVRSGANVPLPVTLFPAPDGRRVEIWSPPDGSGSSSLTLGGTLSDLAGNTLAAPATCVVRYPEWQMPGRDDVAFPKGTGGPQLVLGAPVTGQGFPPTLLASEWGRARLHSLVDEHWSHQWGVLPTLDPAALVEGPALAGNAAGDVLATWVEVSGSERRVVVARRGPWDWAWVGTPVNVGSGSGARQPTIAADGLGAPVVAWVEDRGGVAVLVARRWNGSAWADLGDGSPLNGNASWPASAPRLVLDAAGLPVLAWREGIASGEEVVRVRRWVGQGWTDPLGGFLAGTARLPSGPSLALDAAGQPVIAWSEPVSGVEQVFVRGWNGSTWIGIGGPISPGGGLWARSPSLALGPGDVPYLAVIEPGTRADEVHVLRFDGADWVDVSGPLNLDPRRAADAPWLTVDARGRPAVAWLEGGSVLGFRRYNR